MPIVEARNLTKIYGAGEAAVTALAGVDIAVEPGEFVAVMGPSGCGKSTLLNLLGGLDTATSGEIRIDGTELSGMSDDELTALRRRRFGFVFQFFNLIPVLTATENAALPLTLDGVAQKESHARAVHWLTKVGLSTRLDSRPDQMSGGQQQRVAVARALVTEPALLLADEPTGNLDSKSSAEIADLLQQASAQWGRAILMVTHDPRLAARAGRIVFMRDGQIIDDVRVSGPAQAAEAIGRIGLA